MDNYEFTDRQKTEIGEMVTAKFGCNMQTGIAKDGIPYIYFQEGPNLPIVGYLFYPHGTVDRITE